MKGFTLIELIVVIAIIAILAAIIAPSAFRAIERANVSASIEDYRSIKTGAISYYADTGYWPANTTTTTSPNPFVADDSRSGWDGPYLEKWPTLTRWGGNYSFRDDSSIDWDGVAGGDAARYVVVEGVPAKSAQRMDEQLDGTAGTAAGQVRYSGTAPYSVNILVSTEASVN